MAERDWQVDPGFALEAFLARPLVARLATCGPTGPRVRPVWFIWEERCFWWLTGRWSRLPEMLADDKRVALVIDTCDLDTGRVLQVNARGEASVEAFDAARAERKLARYLGPDCSHWDRERFLVGTFDDDSARLVRMAPTRLRARDLSYQIPPRRTPPG